MASLMISDLTKNSSIPSFMKYMFYILSTACSVLIEMVFLLCPIDVIHYSYSSLISNHFFILWIVYLIVEDNSFGCY